ncbi:MAG: type II toxin-antitoxin system RelE/ParE family toxin [Opitutales bacterium]|nr:type II toxin-antitoxin system RelE/ParE family toxin [Opitutales bacterium]
MDFKISLSPSACEDLRSIISYIASDNPSAAEKFGRRILDEVEITAFMPEVGRIVPEFGKADLRELIARPYRVVYRIKKDLGLIEVVRVWHAARGIPEV